MEALPQIFVQLTILALSFDDESDAYGILNPYGHVFQASFSVSILSATLGMTKFLKNGPCQLIPRDSYGCGFFTAMLITLFSLLAKGMNFLNFVYESGSSTQSMSYKKRSLQLKSDETAQLLNKPYENEVTLRGRKQPLKCW